MNVFQLIEGAQNAYHNKEEMIKKAEEEKEKKDNRKIKLRFWWQLLEKPIDPI